ncbi:MAG: phosphoglycerate mutase family protein [Candidatus Taylorbacteria bacterium]|nr:phosphoglycerate mutase family protein [Candidatus Taylorbacteria bacterium]
MSIQRNAQKTNTKGLFYEKPQIIICRHAESIEDVDNNIYDVLNDLDIPLTEKGVRQAGDFGSDLALILNGTNQVQFYTSPGVRNVQTLEIVQSKLPSRINYQVEIEPLIVKQNWGKINAENRSLIEAERYKVGVLRYTFPTGESASSMISRLKLFWIKICRFQMETGCDVIVFSHGFEFRVLLMIMFGWSEEEFESFGNLANCEYRILTKDVADQYVINKPLRKHGLAITRLKYLNMK